MPRKKIFLPLRNYIENQPGAEKAHYYISKYFIENTDHHICLYYQNIDPDLYIHLKDNKKVTLIQSKSFFLLGLNYHLYICNPDVFLSWRWEYSFIVGILTALLKIKNLCFIHGFLFTEIKDKLKSPFLNILYRKLLIFTGKHVLDHIFVPSRDLKENLLENCGEIFGNKVSIQYNGIPDRKISKELTKTNCKKIMYVGGFYLHKGILELFDIAKKNTEIEFHIYGNTSINIPQEQYNGIKNIIIHGYSDDIQEEMEKYDVLIYPSKLDNLPFAIIEALQQGMLIISTNVGELKYILIDKFNSLILSEEPTNIELSKLGDIPNIRLNGKKTYLRLFQLNTYFKLLDFL